MKYVYIIRYDDYAGEFANNYIFISVRDAIKNLLEKAKSIPMFKEFENVELIRYDIETPVDKRAEIYDALECDVIELQNKDIIWELKRHKPSGIIDIVKKSALQTAISWGASINDLAMLCAWYESYSNVDNTAYIYTVVDNIIQTDEMKTINSSEDFEDLTEDILTYQLGDGHELCLVVYRDGDESSEAKMYVLRHSNSFVCVDTLHLLKKAIEGVEEDDNLNDESKYSIIKVLNDIITSLGGIISE